MRTNLVLGALVLGACWNGEEALHKRCVDDDHCGRGQSCMSGFCDGPPACNPPVPTACDPDKRVFDREPVAGQLRDANLGLAAAAVAGQFKGGPDIDLAVLGPYSVNVFENAGPDNWLQTGLDYTSMISGVNLDLIDADLDSDGTSEFVMLTTDGSIGVIDWNENPDSPFATFPLQDSTVVRLATADLVDDAGLDVAAPGTGRIEVMRNVGGMLSGASITAEPATQLNRPQDLAIVGEGPLTRLIVPDSDESKMNGERNQGVFVYGRGGELIAPLAMDFENPWAVVAGDFLGGDEIEIAVAERRVTTDSGGTTKRGRLRFFRMTNDVPTEVGAGIEIGVGPRSMVAADLDCDGKSDIVISHSGKPSAASSFGAGAPAQVFFGSCEEAATRDSLADFPEVADIALVGGLRMAVGDFDRDGLLEVAIPDLREPPDGEVDPLSVAIVGVQEAD